MRLFVGIPIVDDARREILALLGRLRGSDWPVRWVNDEGLHITLKFFGEVAPERLDVIEEAVRFAGQDTGALDLRLDELGAFPSVVRPRILWVGIDAPPALELLHDRIERGGEAIGFAPEGVPFRPHVTLGRVREGHRLPSHALDEAGRSLAAVPFVGNRLVLYESVLTTQGPRYTARLTLELAP
ncbi:MAG TPA: RNA 2',3'-cyclic phosphodiesterase [Gemmatimonadales bacterium]|nr:RNA 2',3'-cyclic phosphodiesterase [Gemmatimonadales bacterium]